MIAALRKLFSRRPPLPANADQAALRAADASRRMYPREEVAGTSVRAVDGDRIIICVRYNVMARPCKLRYFSVSLSTLEVLGEEPTSKWWPRGLK